MMKTLVLAVLPLIANAADVTGEWNLRLIRFGEQFASARVNLKAEGTKVSGTLNELTLAGTVDGDRLAITATRPNGNEWGKFDGRLQGDDLAGTVTQGTDEFAWKAHRAPATKTTPTTHTFEPTTFYRVFSGSIAPVLHINPGDTVKTTTVDAGGRDSRDARRSMGGNPETGPFYVEGAMPGDTLTIKLNRLRLNRNSAGSGDRIVPGAVQAGYYRDAKFDDKFSSEWKLDRDANVGMLSKPTERLKNFKVKLQPMLGCIGVAPPANQSFRSGWLGSWGGNMDYNEVREGVTVFLPVNQEGALLFVGDGHALEGDGELNGDALETSMDVEFTVDLIKGKSTQAPRFENDEYLMASGIAGSLPDALQQATTELARWLERDYKLSANESNIVLGTSIRYDIAEVVDPQVHIVAKIRKSVLAQLGEGIAAARP
jgi:amidase